MRCSDTLTHARIFCCTVTSEFIWKFPSSKRECMCAHLHGLSPAAGGEGFRWCSISFLCWNSNKGWNSEKNSTTVSHKHAPRHQDMRNTGEFVIKEQASHKRNQTTQNFLMERNQCKKGILPLREWKGWDCSCIFMSIFMCTSNCTCLVQKSWDMGALAAAVDDWWQCLTILTTRRHLLQLITFFPIPKGVGE